MTVTTELPGTNTPVQPRGRAAGLALLSVCLGYFMVLLDGSALNIALPSIQQDVHGTMSTLQWLVNLYTIPLASLLLSFAVLLTIGTSYLNRRWKTRGMRWLLLVGSSIATIGTVLCLAAGDEKTWPILAIGFGITGLGGGILAPSINGAALAEADSQYSGIASGVLNTFRQMGLAVGVAVLGAILAGGNRVTDLRTDLAIGALCFLTVALLSRRHIHR
ncbi:MFS transporter [Streptomyces noursei]